jgi:hypothetical protein
VGGDNSSPLPPGVSAVLLETTVGTMDMLPQGAVLTTGLSKGAFCRSSDSLMRDEAVAYCKPAGIRSALPVLIGGWCNLPNWPPHM